MRGDTEQNFTNKHVDSSRNQLDPKETPVDSQCKLEPKNDLESKIYIKRLLFEVTSFKSSCELWYGCLWPDMEYSGQLVLPVIEKVGNEP